MGALDPIAGISLEQYADLAAKMKDCGGDLDVCAQIAAQNGVDRTTWEAAMNGWNERMHNTATAGEVALAYMPLYQAALAKTGSIASASFEDYVGMSAMLSSPAWGLDKMYAHYGITVNDWSQISMHWVDALTKDQALATRFATEKQAHMDRMAAGGVPPVAGQGQAAQVSAQEVVAAAQGISSLPPIAVGENCYVLWPDGNKYPGQVKEAGDGQCLIVFSNGREEWVPNDRISAE